MTTKPQFLVMTTADCETLLERNHVGRLAFTHEGVIDIEPIGYVFQGGWLFMRSAYGTKLQALSHNPFVAFQVDEVQGPFDWQSVVVHGTIYMLPQDGAPLEKREFERAVAAMRAVIPQTLTKDDPTPTRQIVYGVHIDRVDGRIASSGSGPSKSRRPQPVRPPPKGPGARDSF